MIAPLHPWAGVAPLHPFGDDLTDLLDTPSHDDLSGQIDDAGSDMYGPSPPPGSSIDPSGRTIVLPSSGGTSEPIYITAKRPPVMMPTQIVTPMKAGTVAALAIIGGIFLWSYR